MLGTLGNRGLRQVDRQDVALPARRETFDMARRGRYLALLRRWAQERLPAGTRAAQDAAEWVRDALSGTAGPEGEVARDAVREGASLLVRLRARLLADRPQQLRTRLAERTAPSARVEQLIGCDHLDVWEGALAALGRRPREFVILRIEFGLDYEAIAIEMGIGVTAARAETVNALAALIDALGGQRRDRAA